MAINSFPPAGGAGGYEFPSEFIDPVSKFRVSQPENLIDTDFEYGLQPTKWETVELINNTPSFFSKSGDTTIPGINSIITNAGTREIIVKTELDHGLAVGIPINVTGTKEITADGAYIINSIPDTKTFTYLAKDVQDETSSILDLYSSIITGEFFQGSQLRISDSDGIVTDAEGTSILTVTTNTTHGFGENTPFYFLNLNSTVAQEFQSANTASKTFDASNSATAQTFDGSNTLSSFSIDWSNSATEGGTVSQITSTDTANSRITVSHTTENFANLLLGTPLYYSVSATSGFFQLNPRGVVFLKTTTSLGTSSSTFQVSLVPDGDPILFGTSLSGTFQVANQARTFAGNNINPATQIDIEAAAGEPFSFDGGNQGYSGDPIGSPIDSTLTISSYSGTTVNASGNALADYYVGAMLRYNSSGADATGLSSNTTYFVTAFAPGSESGLFTMSISELPGEDAENISISGGSGTQTFSKIGVSVDKNIVHVPNSSFQEGDMLEYTYPENSTPGNFTANFEQNFYFVSTAYDTHNYTLKQDASYTPITATGGNFVTASFEDGILYKIHQFTDVGSSTFSVTNAGQDGLLEFLLVGGGGAGGFNGGGGGGGGSVVLAETEVSVQDYTITVGAGGAKRNSNDAYSNSASVGGVGGSTSGFGVTATGGGGGGVYDNLAGSAGGNGGGGGDGFGAAGVGTAPTLPAGVTGTVYAGNNGAIGQGALGRHIGGGGGGAGGPATTRNGGPGVPISILGPTYHFGGGGGAGVWAQTAGNGGIGGAGGGGRQDGAGGTGGGSALNSGANGQNGVNRSDSGGNAGANTGGGGGGATFYADGGARAGNGGSGFAAIRYKLTDSNTGNFIVATGGTFSTVIENGTLYAVHSFTNVGASTFEITSLANQASGNTLEFLVVGGGGAGGFNGGGGGGGGSVILASTQPQVQSYPLVVGAGGAKRNSNDGYSNSASVGGQGGSSSIFGVTATGGGGGGVYDNLAGSAGGNGGGGGDGFGAAGVGTAPTLPAGVTGTVYAGNNGAIGQGALGRHIGGGGGGAGGPATTRNGGPGVPISILGPTYHFGGGGGAGVWAQTAGNGGIGGAGGGGRQDGAGGTGGGSALNSGANGQNGVNRSDSGGNAGANTGGGGGGATFYADGGARAGNGGSGFIAIRYPIGTVGTVS